MNFQRINLMVVVTPVLLVSVVIGALYPSSAHAASPLSGPTSGGTLVTGEVPAGITFTDVSAGQSHALAIANDGSIYSWGSASDGRLGNGETTGSVTRPTKISAPNGVKFVSVSAGNSHSLAIGDDGITYAWGDGSAGELGDGNGAGSSVPVPVAKPNDITFTSVSAGDYSSVAIGSDGGVYAWGYNSSGQLGVGNISNSLVPIRVNIPQGVTCSQATTGGFKAFAVCDDGNTYAWGTNNDGELGIGTTVPHLNPVIVTSPPAGFSGTATAPSISMGITSQGDVYSWGSNLYGQVDPSSSSLQFPLPMKVNVTSASNIAAGPSHSGIIDPDGNIYMWGSNYVGEIGDGTTSFDPTSPTQIVAPVGVKFMDLSLGYSFSVALSTSGEIYTWGWNYTGQLGDETTTSRSTPQSITAVTVTDVAFGGTSASSVSSAGTQWHATTPAGCGAQEVVVYSSQLGVSWSTAQGDFSFGTAPVVTANPMSTEVQNGDTFTVSAAASGDDEPSVQWQESADGGSSWSDITGANSGTYSASLSQDTQLRAVFTNCLGTATSETANVRVLLRPVDPTPSPTPSHGGSLANTGADLSWLPLLFFAVVAIATGTASLLSQRRRRDRGES